MAVRVAREDAPRAAEGPQPGAGGGGGGARAGPLPEHGPELHVCGAGVAHAPAEGAAAAARPARRAAGAWEGVAGGGAPATAKQRGLLEILLDRLAHPHLSRPPPPGRSTCAEAGGR